MMKALKEEVIYINHTRDLELLVGQLKEYSCLAVDTESNGLYVYQEQVCLIQISTSDCDYLIDPLAISDLSALKEIFEDINIEKVFHAAEYDVITMKRDYGFIVNNIFDTMIAGRILGMQKLGLAAMLETFFNVQVDKRFQKSDWGKRPLPVEQIDYARLDTHYLIDLRNILYSQLEQKNRLELAHEDFSRLTHVSIPAGLNGGTKCWKIAGKYDISPQQAAVLQELCEYREEKAKSINLPLFKVLSNQTLLQIALETPQTREALSHIKGMTPRNIRRHAFAILKAVQIGLRAEPLYRPSSTKPGADFLLRLENLRNWRKVTARQIGVESDIVLPRDILEIIARKNPQNQEELSLIMQDIPWRYKQYSHQIIKIL
ncbi:MAG: ribonuclease D [Anaerolineaceae bacterium]|nr:ribonuclease D [Anaerolineaceae bacterium]